MKNINIVLTVQGSAKSIYIVLTVQGSAKTRKYIFKIIRRISHHLIDP